MKNRKLIVNGAVKMKIACYYLRMIVTASIGWQLYQLSDANLFLLLLGIAFLIAALVAFHKGIRLQLAMIRTKRRLLKVLTALWDDRWSRIEWLNRPQRALGYEIPIEYATTEERTREVERIIMAIAHGVFL